MNISKTKVDTMEIRSGIPFPKYKSNSIVERLKIMEVGDSFIAGQYESKLIHKVSAIISIYRKRNAKKKFAQRKLEDGTLGVWRLK